MLTLLPGGKSFKPSLVKFQWVEDLIYFDGPVLSYVRANSQQDYFYLWIDNDWQYNRWLAIPVTRQMIRDYKNRRISLLGLIQQATAVDVVDIENDLSVKRAFSLPFDKIPLDLMPSSDSFFNPDFCPTGENVLSDSTSYYLGLDGDWFMEDFTFLQKRYDQIYAFLYTAMNLGRTSIVENIKRIFESGNWYGGFSRVNFFNSLDRAIPSMHEPRVQALRYASPGYIKLELWSQASEKINEVATTTIQNETEVDETVREIDKFLREKDLKSKGNETVLTQKARLELTDLSDALCRLLGIGEFESSFKQLTEGDPIRYAKILLSFHRRLNDVVPFVQRGMLKLKVKKEDYQFHRIFTD